MKKRLLTLLLTLGSMLLPTVMLAEARKEVSPQEASTYPFHLTQALIAKRGSVQTTRGTGTYLGKGAFLTAAHNLTNERGQLWSGQTIHTYNAQGTEVFHTGSSAKPYYLSTSYSGYEDLKNDLALIQVESSLGLPTDKQELQLAVYLEPQKLLGKTVSTMGFSSLTRPPYTQASGKIVRVEADGTLTADLGLVQENSGSPVFLNGEIIGIITAVTEECQGQSICHQATITPLTKDLKERVLDKLKLGVRLVN